jgi:hypothetical protein
MRFIINTDITIDINTMPCGVWYDIAPVILEWRYGSLRSSKSTFHKVCRLTSSHYVLVLDDVAWQDVFLDGNKFNRNPLGYTREELLSLLDIISPTSHDDPNYSNCLTYMKYAGGSINAL